jgi:hypothetical protein
LTKVRFHIYSLSASKRDVTGAWFSRPQLAKSRLFPARLNEGGLSHGEETT